MWIAFALASSLFAGLTAILAKCGIRHTDSTVATALRTIVVLAFAWVMVFVVGSQGVLPQVSAISWLFLVLIGLATGASWLCYFRALQLGYVNKVAPVDKGCLDINRRRLAPCSPARIYPVPYPEGMPGDAPRAQQRYRYAGAPALPPAHLAEGGAREEAPGLLASGGVSAAYARLMNAW